MVEKASYVKKSLPKETGIPTSTSSKNPADQYYMVANTISKGDHPLLKELSFVDDKSGCSTLNNSEQIFDLNNSCCKGFTYIGVDKTYNLK